MVHHQIPNFVFGPGQTAPLSPSPTSLSLLLQCIVSQPDGVLLHWIPPLRHRNALFLNHTQSPLRLGTERLALNSDLWHGGMMHCATASRPAHDFFSLLSPFHCLIRRHVRSLFTLFKILSVFQQGETWSEIFKRDKYSSAFTIVL